MTNKYSGKVQFINQKEFNGKVLHSFKLQGETQYYNCGTVAPSIEKGTTIEFEGEPDAKGNVTVNVSSIEQTKGAVKPGIFSGANKGSFAKAIRSEGMNKDKYWEDKAERDVQTQKTIQLQSSRNSAIAAASLILQANAIPGFAKAKPNEQMDIVLNLVDHITERYQDQVAASKEPQAGPADVLRDAKPDSAAEEALVGDEWS